MALVKCPECGRENVSNLAESCPSCGYGLKAHFEQENTQRQKDSINEINHYNDFAIRGGVLLKYRGNDKMVVIPDTIVEIGERAFENCRNLEHVVMPSTVTEIGVEAFFKCSALERIVLSQRLRCIDSGAFSKCASLQEITFPDSIEEISTGAFAECASLKEIILPESVEKIGWGAFAGCTSLEAVNIPKSIKEIGNGAFEKCPSLADVSLMVKKYESSHYGLRHIFEEHIEDSSLDVDEYLDEQCGPWYLNYKKEKEKEAEEFREKQQEWRESNLCEHCGGQFKGWGERVCSVCGKRNYYRSNGCFVATAVYGSYDCPEVWTLRRFRDDTLAESWYGRAFIHLYYAISPTLVKWFGKTAWFKKLCKPALDRMVEKLNNAGVDNTAYSDKSW